MRKRKCRAFQVLFGVDKWGIGFTSRRQVIELVEAVVESSYAVSGHTVQIKFSFIEVLSTPKTTPGYGVMQHSIGVILEFSLKSTSDMYVYIYMATPTGDADRYLRSIPFAKPTSMTKKNEHP